MSNGLVYTFVNISSNAFWIADETLLTKLSCGRPIQGSTLNPLYRPIGALSIIAGAQARAASFLNSRQARTVPQSLRTVDYSALDHLPLDWHCPPKP